jgi:hypothetical protein
MGCGTCWTCASSDQRILLTAEICHDGSKVGEPTEVIDKRADPSQHHEPYASSRLEAVVQGEAVLDAGGHGRTIWWFVDQNWKDSLNVAAAGY